MKKILFFTLITLCATKINAQCAVATQSLSENFAVVPPCWYGIGTSVSGGIFALSPGGTGQKVMILPKTINAKGILEFDVKNITNGNPTITLFIGTVSSQVSTAMTTFQQIKAHSVPMASSGGVIIYAHHIVDLSNYVGSDQFIALAVNGSSYYPNLQFDNVTYNSACISTSVIAVAQNYTVQLNSNGIVNVTPSNINNGSSSDCGTPSLSLNKTFFDCSNVGINSVTLTATDNNSNTAVANASVTVLPAINNETVTSAQNIICTGNSSTITTGSSLNGIKYYLRDDANNNVIAGPIIGTGNALSFNTGSLTTNTTFNVFAETTGGGSNYGLDFDGTNDRITTTLTTSTTNSLTIEAWIFPRSVNNDKIVSNYVGTTTGGEFIFDNYDATTNNGRALRLFVEGPSNVGYVIGVVNVLTLNAWNHVASTFNNGVTKLYVNGIAVATTTAPFTSIPSCTNTICIGEDVTIGALEYFNGKMDEVRIWNTARTASEILGNMNNCLLGNESGLKTYFKFSENAGSTVTDLVTNSIGTMSGMDPNTDWITGNVDCGTAICNLEMTQTITVNVNPLPTINATTDHTIICAGETTSLTATGASTYTWNPGGSGTSISVSPTVTTTYSVIGTDANGCINNTIFTQSVSLCTGINHLTNTINEVSIFPNPSSINLTVKTDTEIQTIFIYNSLGALVQTEKTNTFSVEQLSTGLYILKVKTEKGTSTIRFIKE